ncbi:MAG: ATP-dependent DNA helicase [Verrucomicrobiae bacterium]|nr:ATP-dependent DNA helicase [Verrucomicrobiae bacterium]
MIRPLTPQERGLSHLRDVTDRIFAPTGPLASHPACEYREPQHRMALAVADAFASAEHLAVEAGTGVGKSFAYLVPAIVLSRQANQAVIISTHTINLQEQLLRKDIPFLQALLPDHPFEAVVVKGRANYLCPRRLERALRDATSLFAGDELAELQRIAQWARHTSDGSLSDLHPLPSPRVWDEVCSLRGVCAPKRCEQHGARCFYQHARRRLHSVNLIIINHALLFSELALRATARADDANDPSVLIPFARYLVLDEAHTIELVAARHLGSEITHGMLRWWLQRLWNPKTQRGLLATLRQGKIVATVAELTQQIDLFFESARRAILKLAKPDDADTSDSSVQVRIREPNFVPDTITDPLLSLLHQLHELRRKTDDEDLREELTESHRRGHELRLALQTFLTQSLPDCVYYAETSPRNIALCSSPTDLGPLLRELLFAPHSSVILTSATLSVQQRLDYFLCRIGQPEMQSVVLGSPFDFPRQMKILIPRAMPPPDDAEYLPQLVHWLKHFIVMTRGKALVLFTSYRALQHCATAMTGFFRQQHLQLLVQGPEASSRALLDEFRRDTDSVLFGTDTFWQGVDVPGEALRNLIITRLPFFPPNQPYREAQQERIAARGGDPFREYALPEAILKFRQGVGRLIRSRSDTGIVVILDSRILTKPYGTAFLHSIPSCPVEIL